MLFLKLICSSFSDRLCTFLKISNFLNQIKCSCTVFPWFSFQKNQKYFHAIFGDHILLGSVAMWKPLFGNRAPKLPFPFTLPNHWRWWWPLARAWKKKITRKVKSGKSVLEWRKITISLHFAATLEVVVIWSRPTKESFLWGLLLYWLLQTKKGNSEMFRHEKSRHLKILTGIRLPLLPFLQHWSDHWLTYTHTYWHVLTKMN